jgi:hypothetical protein
MTRFIWGSGGGAGSDDIAYVEANDLGTANATGASDLIEILKAYDNWGNISPVTAASESLTPAGDASNLWTDLLSALDPGSAATDSTNFLSELASLF